MKKSIRSLIFTIFLLIIISQIVSTKATPSEAAVFDDLPIHFPDELDKFDFFNILETISTETGTGYKLEIFMD
jgi:hypothetical protein